MNTLIGNNFRARLRTLFAITMLTGLGISTSLTNALADEPAVDLVANGKASFEMHCARCHGIEAKGNGMDAKRLPVTPRNLTEGIIKFKSTVSGTPPSDEDFMWIINHGMSGAGMPSFANLSTDVKTGLVAYIKTLSPEYTKYKPEPLPEPNIHAKVDLKKGKEVYDKLQCALCHGASGRANGTSAATLVDSWKQPILPANLAQGWTYRAGNSPKEVYHRLMAGINGAPMPSYQGAVPDEDSWQLAQYISSLQLKAAWALNIVVTKHPGDLPTTASDSAWTQVKRTNIPLSSWFYAQGKRQHVSIRSVAVQAISNGKSVAYKLQWSDATRNDKDNVDSLLIAFKNPDFPASGLDNLYTLYTPDSPTMPMTLWKANQPTVVSDVTSNLDGVNKATVSQTYSADAKYDDGLWTLVFVKPISSEKEPLSLGFAAWDGSTNQAKNSESVSKWVALSFGEPAHH